MTLMEQMGNAWRIRELRQKMLITVGLLAICRMGVYIPLPGIDVAALGKYFERMGGGVMGMLNLFSGGALSRGAVFALGIMPYITASIIFTLLGNVVPSLEALKREGAAGQRKLNQYTRVTTLGVCMFQGIIMTKALLAGTDIVAGSITATWFGSVKFVFVGALLLTAGTMFLMWLGEQIDQHGIGNGISMIIMINILARFPRAIMQLSERIQNEESQQNAILTVIVLLALFVGIIVAIVYITQGERRIPVQQQKHVRGPKVYGGQKHYLPLRVNTAGVLPIIFASVLLQFPQFIAKWAINSMKSGSFWYGFFKKISTMFGPTGKSVPFTYVTVYGLLIFFFCYFWTAVVFNPKEMSENLQSYGSFIPGIRPGQRTANYLEGIMNRITLAGASFLLAIALLPTVIAASLGGYWGVAGLMGGTSILIVVGVSLDLVRRINDHLEMRRYSGFGAGAGGRRRSRRR
ncbi:MAG: preprotein translocase subunit SecY [Planctomycetes bacterium]|nr:preprotein translocase subunit SecY [Planctomycetota bacterium]